nr:hypothetical protein B0A51_06964 [Rachicladosporium sp. CCFEE 5018]
MADSDPISEATPTKRRKLNSQGREWNEEDDSGDDLFEEEATIATIPVPRQLGYSKDRMHSELGNLRQSSPLNPHVTQPTQTLKPTYIDTAPMYTAPSQFGGTQPTQLFGPLAAQEVQVGQSSPPAPEARLPTMQAPPAPMTRAPFSKPKSFIGSLMAPPGTAFRRPQGIPLPTSAAQPIALEDSDEDPKHYSSDEGTQGLTSSIRPTNFTKGGRGLNSSPNRTIREPVIAESPSGPAPFAAMTQRFAYNANSASTDMASAYGSTSRAPRAPMVPKVRQTGPARALQGQSMARTYNTLDDIQDYRMRKKVERMMVILPQEPVDRCMDALVKRMGNESDAMEWLTETAIDHDELAPTPVKSNGVRGVAQPSSSQYSSQPVRPMKTVRQDVKAPTKTIAEKYNQVSRKQSKPNLEDDDDSDDAPRPKGRLINRAKTSRPVSSSPPPPKQKMPQPLQRQARAKATITIDSDSEGDAAAVSEEDPITQILAPTSHQVKLLAFFNDKSVREIADLCAQPESDIQAIVDKRPFGSLDEIRIITNAPELTKSGKKSRTKPIGDKIVDACSEMMTGYDAVDDLVAECEAIGKPIKDASKGWGAGVGEDGELQLMNLDEAHDSGIGTPTSSAGSPAPNGTSSAKETTASNVKGRFIGQPEKMSTEFPLKDYQLVGLNWLNLLWSKKLACILADDMGLGKTCQVIAFLAYLQSQNVDGTHLVIVPGSTLENWLREFARFAPELVVRTYYGSQVERPELQLALEDERSEIDVIVTTYDMAVKPDDNKFLRGLEPAVCVYDEAHALRNTQSDRYNQLMKIKADFKVLLTGTPLQNNLRELIAVLGFIMPDLFAQKKDDLDYIFHHKATTKDDDHAALLSRERIAKARSMMTPFILRRKKKDVLWLPAKHSRVEHCDMTASQAKAYAAELEAAQKVFSEKGTKKLSTKTSSNVLMSLRKTAIHPLLSRRLFDDKKLLKIQTALLKSEEFGQNRPDQVWNYLTGDKGPQSIKGGDYGLHCFCADAGRPFLHKFALKKQEWMDSGKVKKFRELVEAYVKNGDRALVFSQFTTLMDILEAVLQTLGIKYMRLDGSTNMGLRQDMLDKFHAEEDISIFMLSTKAGGAGINLACANKVIIFDSGFNPQDDVQAENRAHRVGQTRDVEVVRLVTRGTIEEAIWQLGESKLALDSMVSSEGVADMEAEKKGEKEVERMVREGLMGGGGGDLKEDFKKGLEGAGLSVG